MSPMDFICMDLIGEFHPPTRHGYRFALTACCMLTGFTWCVPLKTKTADEVVMHTRTTLPAHLEEV